MKDSAEKYPYFIYPLINEMQQCTDIEEMKKIRERIAVNIGDPDALMAVVGGPDIRNFYGNRRRSASTEDTIDAFMARFSSGDEPQSLSDILEPKAERKRKTAPKKSETETKTSRQDLEEVKKLVKNGDYERALDIMRHFYLNNPKKSVYFADQIRFIRKMMYNESKKAGKPTV